MAYRRTTRRRCNARHETHYSAGPHPQTRHPPATLVIAWRFSHRARVAAPSFCCSAIAKTRNDVSYFNSVFSKFANRAPANSTRTFANFPAFFLYQAVNVNGPFPKAIGEAYTVCCDSIKLSAIQSFSSDFAAKAASAACNFLAAFTAVFKLLLAPSRSSQNACNSQLVQLSLTRFPPESPFGSVLLTRVEECSG